MKTRNYVRAERNMLEPNDQALLEALEERYGSTQSAASIIGSESELVGPTECEFGGLREMSLKLVDVLYGYMIRMDELHWAADHNSKHKLTEDIKGALDTLKDEIAEEVMGAGEKTFGPGDITPIITTEIDLGAIIDEIALTLENYRECVERLEGPYDGLISLVDDSIHDIHKYKYLSRMA